MISKHAVVESSQIGHNVRIDEFAVVRAGAVLGNDVVLHPHVVIADGVVLQDAVEVFPGAFIGKEPKGAGATARTPVFNRRVVIGSNVSVGPNAVIFYDVEIGSRTLIGDGASIREKCRIGSDCLVSRYVTFNYNSTMGDRSKIMDLTHITGNSRIGDDVFISTGVSTMNDNAMGTKGYTVAEIRGPEVANGAMIGGGATLLPGVVVGAHAIVGSGSLVTRSVQPHTTVLGVPARPRQKS